MGYAYDKEDEIYFSSYSSGRLDLREIEELGYDMSLDDNLCNLIGREEELKRIIKSVAIKGKSVILLGEPGCGKTSIVEKLALDIKHNKNKFLKGKTLFYFNPAGALAGTKYRGEFEERINKLVKFCKKYKEKIIVFIDEMHTLYGLGAAEGAIDAMNILKPYISKGDIVIIGATTKDEYEKHIANDPPFCRRFENIEISLPDKDMNVKILLDYINKLERKYKVKLYLGRGKTKISYVERILSVTDGKSGYVSGSVKIENPTLAKNILENAFAEAVYNDRTTVCINDIENAALEYDKLSLEFFSEYGFDLSTSDNLCNVLGRKNELERIIQAISIENNSVLIIGDSGTGKTAIVEKLALDIKNEECYFLKDKVIFYLDVGNLIADSRYRGEFEKKMKSLTNLCAKNKGKIIIFIDEIHTLYGLGRTDSSTIDAMNILKPYITRGEITIIGTTTKEEYNQYMSKDYAFLRRFEHIMLKPLTEVEKTNILISYISELENKYKINMHSINILLLNKIMNFIVKITENKCLMNDNFDKIDNITMAKRILEHAFSRCIYSMQENVTYEDIYFSILSCDNLSVEFRKECAEALKDYVSNNNNALCDIEIPRFSKTKTIGFNYY